MARGRSTCTPPPTRRPGRGATRCARSRRRARGAPRGAGGGGGGARAWAAGAPLLFGGDVNLHGRPELPGMLRVGGNHVDHLYTDGRAAIRVEVLERGRLS